MNITKEEMIAKRERLIKQKQLARENKVIFIYIYILLEEESGDKRSKSRRNNKDWE